MKHIFKEGDLNRPTLLLLHGTGGDEYSLLEVARLIDSQAPVLSVKGNIDENGMARFFKRLSQGIFDEEDLIFRTKELNEFLDHAAEKYEFNRGNIVAIGYSNGANIAASLLLLYPESFRAAILHHPMVPIRDFTKKSLKEIPIFIGAGENDPICSLEETRELEKIFKKLDGDVKVHWENQGHSLTTTEIKAAQKWYMDKIWDRNP